MNPISILYFLFIILNTSSVLLANEQKEPDPDILQAIEAYEERSWELGLAAGYGIRTNPLVNSDDIPMYVLLNAAWFGDCFFFDNGDLGVTVHETDKLSFNVITHLNNEREIFEWLNDNQLGIQFASAIPLSPSVGADVAGSNNTFTENTHNFDLIHLGQELNAIEIPKRSLAVDGGLEIIYSDDWGDLQLQVLTDFSFTHNGMEVWASYAIPWHMGQWTIVPSVGGTWKSRHLLDYYYGVRKHEARFNRPAYKASDGFNSFIKLSVSYAINANWGIVGVAEYENLSRSIRYSPLVDEDSIKTLFIGIMYNF